MIEDLKATSARWDAERHAQPTRHPPARYHLSNTHELRRHHGSAGQPFLPSHVPDPVFDSHRYPGTGAPVYNRSAGNVTAPSPAYPATASSYSAILEQTFLPPRPPGPGPDSKRNSKLGKSGDILRLKLINDRMESEPDKSPTDGLEEQRQRQLEPVADELGHAMEVPTIKSNDEDSPRAFQGQQGGGNSRVRMSGVVRRVPIQAGETSSLGDASQHQPAPSIHSSALMSEWTKSTIITQTSTQTSIPSHSESVDSRRDSKAARAVMDSIKEDVEDSPAQDLVGSGLFMESSREEIDTLDHASLISATSTAFTPQQREDVIERFSRAILKALRTNLNCGAASDWSRQHILPLVRAALKSFTESVEVDTSKAAQVKGVKLIRHLRPDIARKVQDRVFETYREPDNTAAPMTLSHLTQMDISEKIGRWCSTSPHSYHPVSIESAEGRAKSQLESISSFNFSGKSDSIIASRDETLAEALGVYGAYVNPAEILERFKEQPVFAELVGKIESLLQQYHGQKMHLIRQKTSLSLRRQQGNGNGDGSRLCAVFNVDWNPRDFLTSNYEAGIHQSLKKVIAITGQTDHAELSPVGQYFKMNWPGEEELLVALEKALRGGNGWSRLQKSSSRRRKGLRSLSFDVSMNTLTVTGSEDFIISIAQQVAWLAAVCQEKKDQLTYAYVGFDETSSHTSGMSVFNIDVKLEAVPPEQERGRCWRNLLGPAVLIQGFPVPTRSHGEQGLEVNIATMAAISGTPKAVTFGGGFVFKARYHALVPTERLGSSIQWHVLDTYPKRLEWEDIDKACPTRLRGKANNGALRKCRSFFGWCPRVLELLGTERFEYSTVDYSKAVIPSQRVQVDKLVFGFSQWVTLTADISLGKKDGVVNTRPDDYETILDDARSTHIILHDTAQKRAVQSNAEDLILHLLLHRRENQKADPQRGANSKFGEPIMFANPDRRAKPTRQVMLDNAEKLLSLRKQFSSPDAQARRFKDEVKLVYSTIDALWANAYAGKWKSSVKLGFGTRYGVHGWEYMDVLKDSKSIQPKSITLKGTCGSWDQYAKDIGAVVLFAANLGDVLLPAPPFATCSSFASLPRDECYLAVRVDSVHHLFHRQGSLQDQRKLTDSGLTLRCHKDLFTPCSVARPSPRSKSCCGNHVVRLVSSAALPRDHRPIPLEEDGAVIIGRVKSRNFPWIRGGERNLAPTLPRSSSINQRVPSVTKGKISQHVADNQKTINVIQVGDGLGAVSRPKILPDAESRYLYIDAASSVANGLNSSPLSIPMSSSRTASSNASALLNRTRSSISS
ncbi:hypothetical protein B0I35DRAFT_427322 [Stachybotrys elegans]|uniref:Uncharacterized protein n=1 Tax=Stachybotrys elegans TaxID=80388 RepID=A0A8K0SY44_9HYPO|nr:hypothetical protein B0I35DRAFT_427322 [Stachybotrys elegans]